MHITRAREVGMAMPISHMLAFALMNFGTGITVPVLSLLLMARGATLETLPLVMGVTLVVTVALRGAERCGSRCVGTPAALCVLYGPGHCGLCSTCFGCERVACGGVLGVARHRVGRTQGTLESIEVDRVMAAHAINNPGLRLSALDKLNSMFTVLETRGCWRGRVGGWRAGYA